MTPRTDAEASEGWAGDAVCVSVDFARGLEQENQQLRTRAEAAEALVGEKDKAIQYALGWIDKAMSDEVIHKTWEAVAARLIAARDKTPADMGPELARLREHSDQLTKLAGEHYVLRARVAELERDRARLVAAGFVIRSELGWYHEHPIFGQSPEDKAAIAAWEAAMAKEEGK
jgi:hypothetical protein